MPERRSYFRAFFYITRAQHSVNKLRRGDAMDNTEDKILTDFILELLELQKYTNNGIPFYMNGKKCSPVKAAQECLLKETGSYMRDYVCDEEHHIVAIRFDKVEDCPPG